MGSLSVHRILRSRAFLILPAIAAVLAAGCGGDDSGDDDEAIREVIRLSLTTNDPEGDCNERLSDSFVERTYGSRERCERIQGEDDDDEGDVESVEFASVEVEEDSATAEIEARGGEVGGVSGALEMVREDDQWRIDDVSVPLLRTLVELGLRQAEDLPSSGIDCVQQALSDLPDAEFRSFAYQLIGQQPDSRRRIFELLAGCEGEGGASLLRQVFEQGITESLSQRDASQQEIDCVLSAVRDRLDDEQLVEVLSSPDPGQAAGEILEPAIRGCG